MRRRFGIIIQLTLLMLAVVFGSIYFLHSSMNYTAHELVRDHEVVDLNEETNIQGWQLLSQIEMLRRDVTRLATDMSSSLSRSDPENGVECSLEDIVNDKNQEIFLPYQRVEFVPLNAKGRIPDDVARWAEQISSAEPPTAHPRGRQEMIDSFKIALGDSSLHLSTQFHRQTEPLKLKPEKHAKLVDRRKTDVESTPLVIDQCYHLLWAGKRIEGSSPDQDWLLLVALGMDDAFRDIIGSARHLGFLYDEKGTIYLHPSQQGLVSPQGEFIARIGEEQYEPFEETDLKSTYRSKLRKSNGLELGDQAGVALELKEGMKFYFRETADISLEKETKNKSEKELEEEWQKELTKKRLQLQKINFGYITEGWNSESAYSHRRVSGLEGTIPRIRVMATSKEELEKVLGKVKEELELPDLDWGGSEVLCDDCLLSQVRLPLTADITGGDSDGMKSLTLVRAVFEDELTADITSELDMIEDQAWFGGAIAVLIAFVLSLFITRPLKLITRTTKNISSVVAQRNEEEAEKVESQLAMLNGYLATLPVRRPDEIGELARAFHELVSRVQEYSSQIRERETFLRSILDAALDGIRTIDENGLILSFNPAAERLFGRSEEEVLGKHFEILYPPEVGERIKASLKKYLETGETTLLGKRTELKGLRKDGTTFPLEQSTSEIVLANGSRVFASLLRDVTERKQAERSRELLLANEEKTLALREIAHETIGDLTAILGASDQYRRRFGEDMNSEQSKLLLRVEKSARSLVDFVEDLRDIARINEGKGNLQYSEFSPGEIIEDALALMRPKFVAKNQRVYIEVDSAPSSIQADKNRLRQVLKNIISNACKYTPEGGKITIRANTVDEMLLFEVEDTGIGIPEEDQPKVFSDFFRAGNADSQASGQGLGLALCKRIVTMHQGEIGFQSVPEVGTTFWIRLPLRSNAPIDDRPIDLRLSESVELRGLNVVVACSDKRADELIEILRLARHHVKKIEDGNKLVREATTHVPDVIFCMLNLRELDGRGAVETIRQSPEGIDVPIVLLTRAEIADVQSMGFTGYLKLPVDPRRLEEVLNEIWRVDPSLDRAEIR